MDILIATTFFLKVQFNSQLIYSQICFFFCYLQDRSVCQFYQEKSCFVMSILLLKTILCEFNWAWPFFVGGDHLYTKKLMKVNTAAVSCGSYHCLIVASL